MTDHQVVCDHCELPVWPSEAELLLAADDDADGPLWLHRHPNFCIAGLLKQRNRLQAQLDAALRTPTWQPIATAPRDNRRMLVLAAFTEAGRLTALDWDGIWHSECESWEHPERYWYWATARGAVEEPTHWAFQDEPLPPLTLSTGRTDA